MIRKIDIIPPLTDIISCDLFDNLFYPAFLTDTRKRGCIPLQTNSKYSIFLKVAELGSMSKAAMHCNYSQSAVSQIINSLEDELQMALLHRSQFGVVLTAEGAQILPYIKQLSDAAEAVNEQAAKLKGLEIGHVRIGTFSSVSCHVLAPVLKEFKAVYASISIEIREDDGVTAMLMRNEIDFGFADAPVPRGSDSILIRRDPFLAVVAENSPLAAMDTIPLSTFQHEPTILCDEGSQKEATGIFRRNKITPRVEYTSRDDNLILSLIENGLCIGYMGQLVLNKTPYHVVSPAHRPPGVPRHRACGAQHRECASRHRAPHRLHPGLSGPSERGLTPKKTRGLSGCILTGRVGLSKNYLIACPGHANSMGVRLQTSRILACKRFRSWKVSGFLAGSRSRAAG